jgi:hypothetical protein
MDTSPPSVKADFGFHYDEYLVDLCTVCADTWHWPPLVTLAQPEALLLDMITRVNLKDAIERATEKGGCITAEEVQAWLVTHGTGDSIQPHEYDMTPIDFS